MTAEAEEVVWQVISETDYESRRPRPLLNERVIAESVTDWTPGAPIFITGDEIGTAK